MARGQEIIDNAGGDILRKITVASGIALGAAAAIYTGIGFIDGLINVNLLHSLHLPPMPQPINDNMHMLGLAGPAIGMILDEGSTAFFAWQAGRAKKKNLTIKHSEASSKYDDFDDLPGYRDSLKKNWVAHMDFYGFATFWSWVLPPMGFALSVGRLGAAVHNVGRAVRYMRAANTA